MRKSLALAAITVLAGCGGGGGGGLASAPTAGAAPEQPAGNLVRPTFTIIVGPPSGSTSASVKRKPDYVSSAAQSITITLTSVGGGAPNVTPTSVTSNISGSTCTAGSPCQVAGPPSPPGSVDDYSLVTFDAQNGTGNQLDSATASITPIAGQTNSTPVTMLGIPSSVTISGVPTSWSSDTSGQTAPLTVTVKDHSGQTITGAYASPVEITDADTHSNGTSLTGTNPVSAGCTGSCVDLTSPSDTVTLNYGGLAENPVTLASSVTGSATFTPVLHAIVNDGGPTTSYTGGGPGVDLYTTSSSSPSGYTGTESYEEPGLTDSPYNQALSVTGTPACTGFATVTTGANSTSTGTPFTATAIASPSVGVCAVTVTDGLTDQTNALPTFKVTYTTSGLNASGHARR